MRAVIDSSGSGPVEMTQPQGQDVSLFQGTGGGTVSFYRDDQGIFSSTCTVSTSQLTCAQAQSVTSAADVSGLRVAFPAAAAWQQGVSSPQIFSVALTASSKTSYGPGRRPSPVLTSGHQLMFFDTESVMASTVSTDEVYFIRTCR
jgi:hypothetical protein